MTLHTSLLTCAALVLATAAGAQNPVHWTATPAAQTVTRGDTTAVTLSATIDKGWHIYSLTQKPGGPKPTSITLPKGQPFAFAGDIKALAPTVTFNQTVGINIESYEDKADFTVPIQVDTTAKTGTRKLHLLAHYQVCSSNFCLPPRSENLSVALKVKRAAKKV